MLLREVMTSNPITVRPESDYLAAIALMRAGKVRHLPVVDQERRLVGLVTDRDLASVRVDEPVPHALVGSGTLVRVREVMQRDLAIAPPDYPLEEAAHLMLERRMSCLLVVEDGRLVGILTEMDMVRLLVEMLSGGSESVRLTVQVDNCPGQVAALTGQVARANGNILSIASYPAPSPERLNLTLRIESVPPHVLHSIVEAHPGAELLHIWPGVE